MDNHREISDREEIPGYARILQRSLDELDRRISSAERAMPGGRQHHLTGERMSPVTASEREQRRLQKSRTVYPEHLDSRLEDGIDELNTSGQRRMDARIRKLESDNAELRKKAFELFREPSIEQRNALATARARADSVYGALGRPTPDPMRGERPIDYRARLVYGLKDLSPSLKRANLGGLRADALGAVETQVYQDAMTAAKTGVGIPPGTLRSHEYTAPTGHKTTEYHGDPMAWMAPFMAPGATAKINRAPATMGAKKWAL